MLPARSSFLSIALALAAVGCSSNVAPVSGRVTLDDRPLVNATVIFQLESAQANPGPGSSATTDAQGRFVLELMSGQVKGAIVGKHKVSITAYEGDDTIPSSGSDIVFRKALLSDEYNTRTKLTFDVPAAGTDQADFRLKSRPK